MKKVISLLLVLTVIFASLVFASVTVTAGSTIENALSWALDIANDDSHRYVLGASHSENEGTNYDCSSFVSWALRHAGLNVPISTTYVMRQNFEPYGFVWIPWSSIGGISNLQRGDILLDESTHVEFYYGNNQMLGAHNPNSGISVYGYYNNAYGVSWDGVLRYNEPDPAPINIGERFYAFIINTKMWKHLTVEQNNNVDIRGEKSNYCADQIWKFERQSDNSYKIISTANGECLDVHNASNENGTNVKTCNDNGSDAQRWFIYPNNNSFYLKAKCTDCVLDITGGYSDDGTNVQMYAKNDTYAQAFTVYQIESRPFAANLGTDFTAPILNLKEWITLENGEDGNISLQKETGRSNQLWRFVRQIDGSYKIYSCYDGKCVDLDMALFENGTNIKICDSNDNDAQRWYLYEYNGGYAIQSKRSGKFIDCTGGSLSAGTNLQAWEWNGSNAQVFAIYRGEECKLSAVNLSVTPKKGCAMLNWTKTYGETDYALKIWQGKAYEGEPYRIIRNIPARTNCISVDLPVGYYEAYIISRNAFESYNSNTIGFSITEPFFEPIILGDADNNDAVETFDATYVLRYVATIKLALDMDIFLRNSDVDQSGDVEVYDATYIQRYLAEMKVAYPIGEYITIE